MNEFLTDLGKWFFARGDARTAAALRIAFFAVHLAVLWDFYPMMPLLFGHGGLFGTLEPFPYDISSPRFFLFRHDSPIELQVFFWGSVVATTAAMLGAGTRVMVLIAYTLMYLMQERGPFMIFGADLVMRCVGLWLLFLDCGRVWSVDERIRKRWGRGRDPSITTEVELWPVKAIQIQVALVYAITALLKWKAPPWQDGSAVYYSIQVGDVLHEPTFPWVFDHRVLMASLTYGTLVIESLMPLMLFYRPLRRWGVAAGIAMHTGIDLLMSIRFFSLAMYTGYLAFIDSEDWRVWLAPDGWLGRSRAALSRWRARLARPAS